MVTTACYLAAYVHYRHQSELVHFKSWSSHNHHHITAVEADAKVVLVNAALISTNSAGEHDPDLFNRNVHNNLRRIETRAFILSVVFAPLRWAETGVWYLIDYRRDVD